MAKTYIKISVCHLELVLFFLRETLMVEASLLLNDRGTIVIHIDSTELFQSSYVSSIGDIL